MNNQLSHVIIVPLLALLVCTAITVARMRDLWAAVMLTGIYSFLGAGWMLVLDAPDVAFTEAAVGAGISTFLMLGTLALTSRTAKRPKGFPWVPLLVVTTTGGALVYGTLDMPHYGDPQAPIHQYPKPSYIDIALAQRDGRMHDPRQELNRRHHGDSSAHPPESVPGADETEGHLADEESHSEESHSGEDHNHEAHEPAPNVVTVVLASYRAFDTLGETAVIFTAGIAVMLLLKGRPTGGRS